MFALDGVYPHLLRVPMMLCSARTSCLLSGMLSSYKMKAW